MKRVFKYPLETTGEQILKIPALSNDITLSLNEQVLRVDTQKEIPCIWAMVDDECETVERKIIIKGTGQPCSDVSPQEYLGSYQLLDGDFVGHVFGY